MNPLIAARLAMTTMLRHGNMRSENVTTGAAVHLPRGRMSIVMCRDKTPDHGPSQRTRSRTR